MRHRADKVVSGARVLTVCLVFDFRLPLGNLLHRVQVFLPHRMLDTHILLCAFSKELWMILGANPYPRTDRDICSSWINPSLFTFLGKILDMFCMTHCPFVQSRQIPFLVSTVQQLVQCISCHAIQFCSFLKTLPICNVIAEHFHLFIGILSIALLWLSHTPVPMLFLSVPILSLSIFRNRDRITSII